MQLLCPTPLFTVLTVLLQKKHGLYAPELITSSAAMVTGFILVLCFSLSI